jgi:LytS/YehU family sensor histidine kinase
MIDPPAPGSVPSFMDDRAASQDAAEPVSVHFVNNVLAAAASLIEVEPDDAREVLADLGAFLTHRLRPGRTVSLGQELEHVATYARLERARFPGRVEAELPAAGEPPPAQCVPGEVQAPVAAAVDRWLAEHRRVRVALRARLDGASLEVRIDDPDDPSVAGERLRIALAPQPVGGGVR